MPESLEVRVVPRHLRWEVRVGGVARPLVDWLCTKERALDHAFERAKDVGAQVIVIEGADWAVDQTIHLDRPWERYGLVA